MKIPKVPYAMVLALKMIAAEQTSGDHPLFDGEWRGDSVCAADAPSCHDENVIYYIRTISGKPDLMFVRADKIVDGKAITMGTGEWQYDRAKVTLTMHSPHGSWLLKAEGDQIEGTLKLADGTVFRKMKLRKDR